MEKIFFEYNENSLTLYDAFKEANPPSDIEEIFNKFRKQIYSYADFEIKHFKKLQPFAEYKRLVDFLCNLLKRVCPQQIESAGGADSEAFESMLRYRNKAEFAVAMTSTGPLVGFNKRGSNKIVDCTDCLLQKRATMAAASAVREILKGKLLTVYDARHAQENERSKV